MPERGSEPARYEDALREREALDWLPTVKFTPEERDVLVELLDAAREIDRGVRDGSLVPLAPLQRALSKLDGLGG